MSVDEIPGGQLRSLLSLATDLAQQAGALLLSMRREPLTARSKSSATDQVSAADDAAQHLIIDAISRARPLDGILAEEGIRTTSTSGLTWVVDPLDGTTNYLRGYPGWAVSICVRNKDEPVVAVVLDPVARASYEAIRGDGATRNGDAIHVSDVTQPGEALLATGFSYIADRRRSQAALMSAVLPQVADIRRGGAASLELCHVAEGAVDAFAENDLVEWDWAAGALIVREAGGVTAQWSGGEHVSGIIASTPGLMPALSTLLGLS